MDSQYLSPNSGEHFSNKQLLFDVDSFNESLAFYFPNLPRNGLTTEKGSNQGENASVHYEEKGSNQGEKGSNQGSSKKGPIKEEKGSNQGTKKGPIDRNKDIKVESFNNLILNINLDKGYRIIEEEKSIIYPISFPEKNNLISSAEKRNLTRIQTENLIQIYTMIKLRFDHFKLNNRKNQEDTVVQIPRILFKGITKSYKNLIEILIEDGIIQDWNHGAKAGKKKIKTKDGKVKNVSSFELHKQHSNCYRIINRYPEGSLTPDYPVTIHISGYAWEETLNYFNMKKEKYITKEAKLLMLSRPSDSSALYDIEFPDDIKLFESYKLIADPYGNPVEAYYSKNDSTLLPEGRIYSSFHFSHKKPCSWNDKYYRGNFTAFGEHLVEIFDIKSSVFTLMYCLPELDCEDSERFHAFVMDKDIYKVMVDYLNDPDIDRDKMKELLSEYRNTGCDCKFTGSLTKIDEWFRSNFPVFRDKLLKYPCHYDKEQQRWIKNLQYDYMKVESEIIFYLRKCIINNWKCISWPLHDALYVIEPDLERIDIKKIHEWFENAVIAIKNRK